MNVQAFAREAATIEKIFNNDRDDFIEYVVSIYDPVIEIPRFEGPLERYPKNIETILKQ